LIGAPGGVRVKIGAKSTKAFSSIGCNMMDDGEKEDAFTRFIYTMRINENIAVVGERVVLVPYK
jgi:hypothetical protein